MPPDYERVPIAHLTPDAWERVRLVFESAIRHDPEERETFLESACAGNPTLQREVQALLHLWNDDANAFLETPHPDETSDSASTPAALTEGQLVGPYLVRHEIGRGGMGIVYLADDTRLSRRVALKAIHPTIAHRADNRERLRQEARAAAALSHPGVAVVYALEDIDGALFVASEFVPGHTLRTMLQHGPLPVPVVVDLATQVSRVLAAAHGHGVVHRDLKPENIMRTPAGVVKVLDFGLALHEGFSPSRLTRPGTVVGTPAYMAPEQLLGAPVDFRADQFSFGVVVYEMASGVNPFEGPTMAATIDRVLRVEPERLSARADVPPTLDRIVTTCLKKPSSERYRSSDVLVAELEHISRGVLSVSERPPDRPTDSNVPMASARPVLTSRWWWEFHQIAVSVMYVLMLYPAWRVRVWLPRPWGMLFLFTVLASTAAATTIRLNLRFTARVYPGELARLRARTQSWIRLCDVGLAISLLLGALGIGSAHPEIATLLMVVSTVTIVASLVIEPTTTKAAFRRKSGVVRIPKQRP